MNRWCVPALRLQFKSATGYAHKAGQNNNNLYSAMATGKGAPRKKTPNKHRHETYKALRGGHDIGELICDLFSQKCPDIDLDQGQPDSTIDPKIIEGVSTRKTVKSRGLRKFSQLIISRRRNLQQQLVIYGLCQYFHDG